MLNNLSKTNTLVLILLTLLISWLLFNCNIVNLSSDYTERFKEIIESAKMQDLTIETDKFSKSILTNFEANINAEIAARYATESGAGAKDGTSWENAWAGADLRDNINAITDASANKVYVVLVAGGTYYPTTGSGREISFSMKNYVAIVGGFDTLGSWEYSGTTMFSGDLGKENDTSDNSYNVFYHNGVNLDHALLYGVTLTSGNANGSTDPYFNGGGMHNKVSSPRIINTKFINNSAIEGGALYNVNASPRIIHVQFKDNMAVNSGGGIKNVNSSPSIIDGKFSRNSAGSLGGGVNNNNSVLRISGTVFNDNTAKDGGGIYNDSSTLEMTGTLFSANSATTTGGGMYNAQSTLLIINMVFSGNTADKGGGIYNNSSLTSIINSVLINNTANGSSGAPGGGLYQNNQGSGENLSVYNSIFSGNSTPNTYDTSNDIGVGTTTVAQDIQLVGSILGIGKSDAVIGAARDVGNAVPINITYTSLANVNPGTPYTETRRGIEYTTVSGGSGAKDLGLYVKRSGDDTSGYTYYMSIDGNDWYTAVDIKGAFSGNATQTASLPAGAQDLTAKDFNGKVRTGRPDAGVIEQ